MARISPGRRPDKAPYEGARVEELEEPLLPRWFVLLAVLAVPVAIGVAVWALAGFGGDTIPVEARRPPPAEESGLTTDVGAFNVGETDPEPIPGECRIITGIRAGGTAVDRQLIQSAMHALCDISLPEDTARRLLRFAEAGGVVRFAQFEATGVDSALDPSGPAPVVLVNARFAREGTEPLWIAPLVVHDTTYVELEPGTAEAALAARQAEDDVCQRLFAEDGPEPSRACQDAAAVVALPDPLAALREAGFE